MIDLVSNMAPAQQQSILRKSQHLDLIMEKAAEVNELRRKYDDLKQKAAQAKALLEQARDEKDELEFNGPPKPSPQLKLPLDTDLDALSLPGEIQDALLSAGIESVAVLGSIVRGIHAEIKTVRDVPGITETQGDIIVATFRKWYADQEAKIEAEAEDEGYVTDTDVEYEDMASAGPNESSADDIDQSEFTDKAKIIDPPEETPFKKNQKVIGKALGTEGFLARDEDGTNHFLGPGEFELLTK